MAAVTPTLRVTTPFGNETTAAEVLEGVDLSGRRAVVTGGGSGIGIETARALAGAGAAVTLAVRRTDDGEKVAREIRSDTGNEDVAVKFLKASFKGWIFCRDNPGECVDIVLKHDAKLPKGHQTWQLNEVNGIIWPAPNGIGITDKAAFDRTVQVALDGKILTKPVEGTPWRNDLAQKALDALGSADTKGASWKKAVVVPTEGGK